MKIDKMNSEIGISDSSINSLNKIEFSGTSDTFPSKISDLSIVEKMFDTILKSENVFYKSQQMKDSELTLKEKQKILTNLFVEKPHVFLERYYTFIKSGFV